MRNIAIAVAAVAGLSATSATAASYSVFDELPLTETEIGGSLSVDKFNSALGTLNSVSWTVLASVESLIGITNNASNSQTGSATTQVEFTLTAFNPAAWALDLQDGLSTPGLLEFDVDATTGNQTIAGGGGSQSFDVSGSQSYSGNIPGDFIGSLADWMGPGSAGFDFFTDTGLLIQFGGGNVGATQSTVAGIRLDVTYNYTPDTPPPGVVPLPAALPLLASGLGLVGLMRLRRNRS